MESAPIIVSGMLGLVSVLLTIVGFLIAMLIKDVKGAIVTLTKVVNVVSEEVHIVSKNYVESRVRLDNVERQTQRMNQMGEDVATMKYAMMSYIDKVKKDS